MCKAIFTHYSFTQNGNFSSPRSKRPLVSWTFTTMIFHAGYGNGAGWNETSSRQSSSILSHPFPPLHVFSLFFRVGNIFPLLYYRGRFVSQNKHNLGKCTRPFLSADLSYCSRLLGASGEYLS